MHDDTIHISFSRAHSGAVKDSSHSHHHTAGAPVGRPITSSTTTFHNIDRSPTLLSEGQRRIANSLSDITLVTVPADGSCFFHAVKRLRPEFSIGTLREIAGKRKGWAEEEHISIIAEWLGLHIKCTPIELEALEDGPKWDATVPFGSDRYPTLHLAYWTRNGDGLHFDILEQEPTPSRTGGRLSPYSKEVKTERGSSCNNARRENDIRPESRHRQDKPHNTDGTEASQPVMIQDTIKKLLKEERLGPIKGGGNKGIEATTPYRGNYRGCTWNAQALFTKVEKQEVKWRYMGKLLKNHDFIGITETHSTEGEVKAKDSFEKSTIFWSHYEKKGDSDTDTESKFTGGIALALNNNFLDKFDKVDPSKDWTIVEKGRAAKLSLKSKEGALDIFTCYLTAGSTTDDRKERVDTIKKISDHIDSQNEKLTIIVGDMNFIEQSEDRYNAHFVKEEKRRRTWDKEETDALKELWTFRRGMCERTQNDFTYRLAGAFSRLDRVYTNHHTADQLNHHFSCVVLEWTDCHAKGEAKAVSLQEQ